MPKTLKLASGGAAIVTDKDGVKRHIFKGQTVVVSDAQYAAMEAGLRAVFEVVATTSQPAPGTELDYIRKTNGAITVDNTTLFSILAASRELQGFVLPNVPGGPRPVDLTFECTGFSSVAGVIFMAWFIINGTSGVGYGSSESPNTADSMRLHLQESVILPEGYNVIEVGMSVKSGTASILSGVASGIEYAAWMSAVQR